MADQPSKLKLEVAILLLLFQSTFAQLFQSTSFAEQSALLNLRSTLGLRARDWPRKVDPCLNWVGVQCSEAGRVVGINVSGLRRTRLGRLNPQFSVEGLANFTFLASFNASGFKLPGSIPEWLGQVVLSLKVIDLSSCFIVGSIPVSLGNLGNLSLLYLSGNSITGVIPSSLSQLTSLTVLDLSQNSLAGSIPSSLSSLPNLTNIDLSSNFLSGPIPPTIGDLSSLQSLNLSNNGLSSSIPVQLGNLSRLVELDLGLNSLSGSLPPDLLWSMPSLRFADVSYNNLTGILFNLSSNSNATLATYNLSHNQFYGNLSSQLKRFGYIDLSDNYFEGKVSSEIPNNTSLASNCLQNVTNQNSLKDCTLFYSEKGLSFDNFGNRNITQPPAPSGKPRKKSNKRLAFILAGVFGGLGFIVIFVMLLVLCLRKHERGGVADQNGRSVSPAPGSASPPPAAVTINFTNLGDAFTYEQLLQATGEFSDSNLIKHGHSGDLFRGVLENGVIVVVKRVDVRLFKKESHMVELDLFSKICHTRLVPLLGHCLEHENEKLVVYKYMPNGDLSNSLFKKANNQEDDSLQSLDWITRLKIATGAAEGLNYLHHECNPPLVHRDVQASSILLDDKYEVRLGSLSEVCSQEGDTHQNVITRFLRLPQTSEPGSSGSQSTNCAYDVYCFGKVLLELVTGKLGISAPSDTSSNEWLEQLLPYITIYDRELVTKIVDPSLIIDEDLLEEVWAMAVVARSCLNPKPSKRPLMKYILKALENPLKVVRQESSSSGRLRTTSSRGSWNAGVFGSWRHSSSDIVNASNREGSLRRMSGNNGSQGSGTHGAGDISSSNKKLSRDIFPEPGERSEND
ncbi:hypothetical protein GIB67_042771 [Kingdonia uniflora]|uniref:Protein kinase domain-containing protein n=1 Tax=Kingdonia uniflora TaxID=39325 RepID=A0A7J7L0Y5_9MAGN|nr:hypothetical protein GIB67_042771 [Kingdonia uniflora]